MAKNLEKQTKEKKMSQLVLQITNGANDGYVTDIEYSPSFTSAIVGFGNNSWYLWNNVTIPKGAIIVSAIITFKAFSNRSVNTCNTNMYFNNEDSAISPTSVATYNAKTVTSAIAWTIPAWVINTSYDSPDISTILQTIINRSNWVSGNSLMVLHKNNGSSTNAVRDAISYENSPSNSAILTINYIPPKSNYLHFITDKIKHYSNEILTRHYE